MMPFTVSHRKIIMMILSQSKQLVSSFLKEACNFLALDAYDIRVIYVPIVEAIGGIPQYTYLTPDGTIVISNSFLEHCIERNGFTPLRHEMYCKARMFKKQAMNPKVFNQFSHEALTDAIGFSSAMQSVLGLTIPYIGMPKEEQFIEKAKEVFLSDFSLHVVYHKFQRPDCRALVYKASLEKSDALVYAHKYFPQASESSVRVIDSIEKGTQLNPFDNIYEACEYIKRLESETYIADTVLRNIANAPYFYDLEYSQFRVPWASPHVAFYKNDIPKNAFIINQNASGKFTLKPNLYGHKFLYRGQSQDYPKPCTPNLFRDEKKTYFLDEMIWSQEMELLMKSHPLIKLLDQGVDILHDKFAILMNYGGLSQHYYNKTRFLDLTSNIETMMFFATTNYNWEKDEYTPVLDTKELGMIYCYELQMPNAFQQHADGHHLSVIGKQVFMRSGSQYGFLLDLPQGLDMKKLPEVKMFYFKHDPKISWEIFSQSNQGHKYFPTDILEQAWKEKLKERLTENKISIDTVKVNVSLNPKETEESIIKKLEERGINVDRSYTPTFTKEQLDAYYKSIKNGWWNEFCEDIYFYGSDGIHYKEELKQLVRRPEYQWAFFQR